MTGKGWFWAGVVVWGLSWFLPAVGLGVEGFDVASVDGFRAFRFAWEASWEGDVRPERAVMKLDPGSDDAPARLRAETREHGDDLTGRLLAWTWALNVVMVLAIVLRARGATGSTALAVVLFASAALALGWWFKLGDGRSALKVGYYAWVASFGLSGVGVVRSREAR
jgi:hypothetical protein